MASMISNTFNKWSEKAVSWLALFDSMGGGGDSFLFKLIKRVSYALLTCTVALGGAIVGIIIGAMKGQTTETGFIGGAGTGAMVGAISAVHLLDRMVNGDPFSKVALLYSLLNGKVFMEWVRPALLEAYQWQVSSLEASNIIEHSDIFEINGTKGLSKDIIDMLPTTRFSLDKTDTTSSSQVISCIICLEDFKKGEFIRMLPRCGHIFHQNCIDKWLPRHGSCPICRGEI